MASLMEYPVSSVKLGFTYTIFPLRSVTTTDEAAFLIALDRMNSSCSHSLRSVMSSLTATKWVMAPESSVRGEMLARSQ